MKKKQVVQVNPFHILDTTLIKYRGNDPEITIPSCVTKIEDHAFLGCNHLRCVHIPDTVKEIGANAFQACRNLEIVELPSTLEKLGGAAFSGCISLKELQLPDTLTVVPLYMCCGCTGLEKITIPDKVERIEWRAFGDCNALKSVDLPGSLQWIGEEAFFLCVNLIEIRLPDSVTRIDKRAFFGCKRLKELRLPSKLNAVQNGTFSGCGFSRIEIPKKVKQIDFTAFENCWDLEMIVIHAEHFSIANYGNGDPTTIPTDAPLFFSKPRNLSPALRRNMFRGYARMQLDGNTTPAQEEIYSKYIKDQVRNVCYWAIWDPPLLQYLMRDRLITPALAEEMIQACLLKNNNERAAVLLNYLGNIRTKEKPFDPTEAFDLGN